MNVPNYFIADLPPQAPLTPDTVSEACRTLRRNRLQYLAVRPAPSLVVTLVNLGRRWLDPDYPFRQWALGEGPAATGFSRATLADGLDAFFEQLTAEQLEGLLEQDLGHAQRLDRPWSSDSDQRLGRAAMVRTPEFLVHITAGNLPNPAFSSIILGLLLRSAQFVKCATGSAFLPRVFAHSLYDAEPKLGACLELAEWRGGDQAIEAALFAEADCVTATGSDEALAQVRTRLPAHTRFAGYGSRVSFGYVSQEMLGGVNAHRVAGHAATDVVAWNQLGCLSPHVIYVQHGGVLPPEKFAQLLAEALAQREVTAPRGELPAEVAAAIASRRSIYQLRATHSAHTRHWCSEGSTAWTVIYEADPRFQLSCLHRFIYVKGVKDLTEALESAESVRGKVSTVGVAAPEHQGRELARELARWGVSRVCPLGKMQHPPLLWRHDGRPALGDLVTWSDYELGSTESR